MFGEPRSGSKAEDAGGPQRVEDDAEGGECESFTVQLLQRQADRGDQIGTAADRLGQQDVGGLLAAEGCGRIEQRVEPAAEAAAGDFFDGEVVGPAQRRVNESAGFIVGDQADAEAAAG